MLERTVQSSTERSPLFATQCGMHSKQIEPKQSEEKIEINEHLWEAWQWRNRQRDKRGERRRLRLLQAILVILVGIMFVQNFTRHS